MADDASTASALKWAPVLVTGGLLAALALAWFGWPAFRADALALYHALASDDQRRLAEIARGWGLWGPLLLVLAMTGQMFLLVVPSVALMVVAVLVYGPWWGSALAVLAVAAASSVGYLIGRALGPVTVQRLVGEGSRDRLDEYVARYGIWAVVVTRVSPVFSNDAISLVAGLARMGYLRFLSATVAGILPLTVLIAVAGGQPDQWRKLLLWLSLLALAMLVAYVVYDRKTRRQ